MTPQRHLLTDSTMSFGDHLEELRRRLFLCLVVPVPVAIVAFFFSDTLIRWLLLPLYQVLADKQLPIKVLSLSPPEYLITQVKLSMIAALIVAAPWVMWQAWLFVRPGLYTHERRFVHTLLPGSALLTATGVLLMYYGMLPIMLNVMVAAGTNAHIGAPSMPAVDPRITSALEQSPTITIYAQQPASPPVGQAFVVLPDLDKPFITITGSDGTAEVLAIPVAAKPVIAQEYRLSEYIGFVLLLFLGIAIAFQMPLVVVLLGWLGLASVAWLRSKRRYALFICGIVSAVITPSTDVISMLVMLVPLYGLYELGILLLTIAPASKVAEGTVLSWKRPRTQADKPPAPPAQAASPAQMDGTVPRQSTAAQHTGSAVDDEGTGP